MQSLPFGGVKHSGFGRFAGVEGLRACCLVKSVVVDRWWPYIKTVIPKPIQVCLPNPQFYDSTYSLYYMLHILIRLFPLGSTLFQRMALNSRNHLLKLFMVWMCGIDWGPWSMSLRYCLSRIRPRPPPKEGNEQAETWLALELKRWR